MILKASQRGGGKQLGVHLMRTDDNEHAELHDIRGFVSDDVIGALKEAHAVSLGTKCKQFLFSVSLNPPQNERVSIEVFEETVQRIEEKNGLDGQPRVIVFHEKEGRRHCHAVWSRIDPETMTARNLPFFKTKLRDLSREIYLEKDWKMPRGLMNSTERDPRNFTLAEWQQSKREGVHARDLKTMMQECWAISDTRAAFAGALSERGLVLAKGDRRGHVAVAHQGEVLSVARYTGKKAKDIRARLGEPDNLPSVDEAKTHLKGEMQTALRRHMNEARENHALAMEPLQVRRSAMVENQRAERERLKNGQTQRWNAEAQMRAQRLAQGMKGVWQRISGQYQKLRTQNEREAYAAAHRDRDQRQHMIDAQITERQGLQSEIVDARRQHANVFLKLRGEQRSYGEFNKDDRSPLNESFRAAKLKHATSVQRSQAEKLPSPQVRLERLRRSGQSPRTKPHDRER